MAYECYRVVKSQPVVICYLPSVSAGGMYLHDMLHGVVDFDILGIRQGTILACMGVEVVELVVVGIKPYIVCAVNAYLVDAVGGQLVTAVIGCLECGEPIAVVAAQSVPGSYPHQSVAVLFHAGNVVRRQAVARVESLHITIFLTRRGEGIAAAEYGKQFSYHSLQHRPVAFRSGAAKLRISN